ncbi:MAG: FAD-dependent oxidoreductase [Candidatus Omnitrophica bacterium]|nr:FAD-dependent oxidoreductase [Candidatus Omnitrophota bacterium]
MKKVIIIGGGFCGLTVLNRLLWHKDRLVLRLIDKKTSFDFLPCLPDVLSGLISPDYISCSLPEICQSKGVSFTNSEVLSIDFEQRQVITKVGSFDYDYLVIASGSETNFYGNQTIENNSSKLNDLTDALGFADKIASEDYDCCVIVGGGYSGVEAAANIKRYLKSINLKKRVILIERSQALLPGLEQWMGRYALNALRKFQVEMIFGVSVDNISDETVFLSNGETLSRSLVLWTAGVRGVEFVDKLNLKSDPQSRIKVNQFLKVNEYCFVGGDAASFDYHGFPLRMGVQFSVAQGKIISDNLVRSIRRWPLKSFKPVDLGYVIPIGKGQGCGKILGEDAWGPCVIFLHYLMCIFRAQSFKNKIGMVKGLLKGGRLLW